MLSNNKAENMGSNKSNLVLKSDPEMKLEFGE
jgi:hypothetical protein